MSQFRYHAPAELDLATAPQLLSDLRHAIDHTDGHVLVDCRALTFIDSTGIAALVDAHCTLESQGRQLLVTNVGRTPRRVFEILGLTDILHDDQPSVLA